VRLIIKRQTLNTLRCRKKKKRKMVKKVLEEKNPEAMPEEEFDFEVEDLIDGLDSSIGD